MFYFTSFHMSQINSFIKHNNGKLTEKKNYSSSWHCLLVPALSSQSPCYCPFSQCVGLPCLGEESTCQCRRCGFNLWVRKIPWRRKWQPTPVFLPGTSHRQRSLARYSPCGCKESDTVTKQQQREVFISEGRSFGDIVFWCLLGTVV